MPPLPPSFIPPFPTFATFNVTSIPVNPRGLSFMRVHHSASIAPVTPYPSSSLNLPIITPVDTEEFHVASSKSLVLLYSCLCATASTYHVLPHILVSSGVFWCLMMPELFFFRCPFVRCQEARAPPLPENLSSHPSPMRYLTMLASFRPPVSPPYILHSFPVG